MKNTEGLPSWFLRVERLLVPSKNGESLSMYLTDVTWYHVDCLSRTWPKLLIELQFLDLVPVSLANSILNWDSDKHVCICVCEYLSVFLEG